MRRLSKGALVGQSESACGDCPMAAGAASRGVTLKPSFSKTGGGGRRQQPGIAGALVEGPAHQQQCDISADAAPAEFRLHQDGAQQRILAMDLEAAIAGQRAAEGAEAEEAAVRGGEILGRQLGGTQCLGEARVVRGDLLVAQERAAVILVEVGVRGYRQQVQHGLGRAAELHPKRRDDDGPVDEDGVRGNGREQRRIDPAPDRRARVPGTACRARAAGRAAASRCAAPAGPACAGGRRRLQIFDDMRLDAGMADQRQRVARGAAIRVVIDDDIHGVQAHLRVIVRCCRRLVRSPAAWRRPRRCRGCGAAAR